MEVGIRRKNEANGVRTLELELTSRCIRHVSHFGGGFLDGEESLSADVGGAAQGFRDGGDGKTETLGDILLGCGLRHKRLLIRKNRADRCGLGYPDVMGSRNMPTAAWDIPPELVRTLLEAQHPDLADLQLQRLANGWDNVMYRLGEDLVVRLPRRLAAVDLALHEQVWLPVLGPRLPVPVPIPLRIGAPTDGFPHPWTVLPWLEGEPIGVGDVSDTQKLANDLGGFIAALHTAAPPDAPENAHRAVPLAKRHGVLDRIDALDSAIADRDAVRTCWLDALASPAWAGPALWAHGDLHPLNLLHVDGKLSAVIDFGDITSGDPATDLAVAWMLFDQNDREAFRQAASSPERPIDDAMWVRSRASALALAVLLLDSSADNPPLHSVGELAIATVLSDFDT